jgi:hypothetical protein
MKSQINLLHEEFRPKFEWVCASHFAGAIFAAILLSSGVYGLTTYRLHLKEQQVAAIKKEIKQQQESIEELTLALTQRVSDPVLTSKLASFAEQTRTRGMLLNQIRNLSALKQRSFSGLFDSLSQSNSNELWLTEFLVTPNELNIEGLIAKPRALPLWISELSQTDFFKGQEFNVASVAREQDSLVFKLNSVNKVTSTNIANAEVTNEG